MVPKLSVIYQNITLSDKDIEFLYVGLVGQTKQEYDRFAASMRESQVVLLLDCWLSLCVVHCHWILRSQNIPPLVFGCSSFLLTSMALGSLWRNRGPENPRKILSHTPGKKEWDKFGGSTGWGPRNNYQLRRRILPPEHPRRYRTGLSLEGHRRGELVCGGVVIVHVHHYVG